MNFSDFSKIIYRFIGGDSNSGEFTKKLFHNIVSYNGDNNPIDDYELSAYRSFYNGRRSIGGIAKKITPYLEPSCFSTYIYDVCSDEQASNISEAFYEQLTPISAMDIGDDLATVFCNIIKAATKAKNIDADGTVERLRYFARLTERFYKIKTLLYYDRPVPVDDFYIPNDLYVYTYGRRERVKPDNIILSFKKKFMVIVGTGGLGKTMLIHHLVLKLIKNYDTYEKLPVVLTLRNFRKDHTNLIDFIKESTEISDIENYLKEGKCVFLLDGMDEIRKGLIKTFEQKLADLADRYPQNSFILCSRPVSDFIRLTKFEVFELAPFTKEQALQLIDHLNYRPETPELKKVFREKVDKSLYDTHSDFLEIPLLLTIMLLTFERNSKIPQKMYAFYEDAFWTLAERHDSTKIGFDRAYRTQMFPEEFAKVLEEFCTRTYIARQFSFTEESFKEFYNELKVIDKIDKPITFENLKADFTANLCLMYFDSGKYSFIHRSFQEYFCALHLSKSFDDRFALIGQFFEDNFHCVGADETFNMLYDMTPQKIDKLIFIPYLEDLFSKCNITTEDGFWDYLELIYPEIIYSVGEADPEDNRPQSFIYREILKRKGIIRSEIQNILPYDDDYLQDEFFWADDGDDCFILKKSEIDDTSEYESIDHAGYVCCADIKHVREEDSELHDALLDPLFPYRLEFQEMKGILSSLIKAHEHSSGNKYDALF